jgi:hypothetical protein
VCLNILREDWKPVLNLNAVMVGLQYLFLEPNADDPLNKGKPYLSPRVSHATNFRIAQAPSLTFVLVHFCRRRARPAREPCKVRSERAGLDAGRKRRARDLLGCLGQEVNQLMSIHTITFTPISRLYKRGLEFW